MVGEGFTPCFALRIAWSMSGRMPFAAARAVATLGPGLSDGGPNTYVLTAIVHCAKSFGSGTSMP